MKPHEKLRKQEKVKRIEGISKTGKKIIFVGIFVLILGFFILTKTDPEGQNWASILSPFLLVGAYIIIAIGIIFPEKLTHKEHKDIKNP